MCINIYIYIYIYIYYNNIYIIIMYVIVYWWKNSFLMYICYVSLMRNYFHIFFKFLQINHYYCYKYNFVINQS